MTQTSLPVEQRERCVGRKLDGTQCTRFAHAGATRCHQHGEDRVKPREPTGLTEEDRRKMYDALEDGLSLDAAVVAAGVSRSTVYRWLEMARVDGSHDLYREFEAEIAAARTRLEHQTLQMLKRAAQKGSVPAMRTLLERVAPRARSTAAGGQMQMPTEPRGDRGRGGTNDTDDDQGGAQVIPLKPNTGHADW